jgi:hypothetical protein
VSTQMTCSRAATFLSNEIPTSLTPGMPVRQLFTVRVGLRLTEATQTAMVLGQVARHAGAECDLIADTTPGVGYVMIDGTAQPQRVRAFHVTDPDITDLTTRFSPSKGESRGNEHKMNDAGPDGGLVTPARSTGHRWPRVRRRTS